MRAVRAETSGTIFNKSVQLLGYADDIDIFERTVGAIVETFLNVEREAEREVGFTVNESKTKRMVSSLRQIFLGTHVAIGGYKF